MKDSIFISYRISDTGDVTGRIYDYLVQRFGQDHVFKDVQGIELGCDYRVKIKDALNGCRVMLAVIGPDWLTVTDKDGNRRLEQPGDWVRLEIETALSRGIPIIPLRVKGANLPSESELPQTIKDLAYRNATEIKLHDPDFGKDMAWLVEGLKKYISPIESSAKDESSQQVVLEDLTSEQLQELRIALIAAFPQPQVLALMIGDELKTDLQLITSGEPNYEIAVNKLVQWANAQGKVQELLEGARKKNPGNPKLKKLVNLWLKP